MKKDLKFNHDANSFLDALGLTVDQCAEEFMDVQQSFNASDMYSVSHLAECIHKKFSYENILLLATKEYLNEITKD